MDVRRRLRRFLRDTFGLRTRRSRRRLTYAVVIPTAVAGFGVGYVVGFSRTAATAPASDLVAAGVTAEADTYTRTAAPEATAGSDTELLVGGSDEIGVASAYLRFTVTQAPVSSAKLRLSVAEAAEGQLLEVVAVDARWDEQTLSAAEVPPFGRTLDAASADADGLTFDVSSVVTGVGTYAFAVTSPDERLLTKIKSRESDSPPRLDFRVPVTPSPTDSASPTTPTGTSNGQPEAAGGDPVGGCRLGPKLVPTCGSLWGVAPGARSQVPGSVALARFEDRTGRRQDVYHAYHRGEDMFPTDEERQIAEDPSRPRILFLNWKPQGATWAQIAAGDPATDKYLDRLAEHIKSTYDKPFFFTVHHEPENDVDPRDGSGRTAKDYAAMYRYVVQRLRADGVDNLVTVMVYMAYLNWATKSWHADLYPGDDVVDWVAWDTYAYSDPGYGYGDFAEMVDRTSKDQDEWPGYYRWAARTFPHKPLMLAEWGVWQSGRNPAHQAEVIAQAAAQLSHFPRLKALVYFETANDDGRDSRVDTMPDSLSAYRDLSESRHFQVRLGA